MNFFEKFNKLKNKKQFVSNIPLMLFVGAFALLLVISGTSYAYLTDTQGGTLINTVSVGALTLTLDNESSAIALDRAVPQLDEDAIENNTEYTFTLSNTGDLSAHYEIILNSICSTGSTYNIDGTSVTPDICIDSSYVNIGIKIDNSDWSIISFEDNKAIIDAGQINSGTSKNYTIKLWLDVDTPNDYSALDEEGNEQNVLFTAILSITGEQTNDGLDKIDVNSPELASNMIPVYYDGSTWRKADTTNINDSWYNYSDKKWANAVTVTTDASGSRTDLLNAEVGTEIPMDRINTMWVWIPRFSTTGVIANTVSCSTIETPTYEEHPSCYMYGFATDEDETKFMEWMEFLYEDEAETNAEIILNGGTVDDFDFDAVIQSYEEINSDTITTTTVLDETKNTNYYNGGTLLSPGPFAIEFVSSQETAHDAFTFGTQELNGFWYAKFETAGTLLEDEQACSNETCDISNIIIKPNETSLRNQTVSSLFYTARSMEQSSNPYGFSTTNDSTLNIHMSKNREWGAVAYLTHSKYGRCTKGVCSEITINNCSNFVTGIGADNISDFSSSTTCTTSANMYNGAKGVLASTTGNVYGIYDMSGGTLEYVMGVYSDGTNIYSGNATSSNSGFNGYLYNGNSPIEYTDGIEFFSMSSNNRYYDLYTTEEAYIEAGLQHALSETLGWYSDEANFVFPGFPWFVRGDYYNGGSGTGSFSFASFSGYPYSYYGTRFAVIVK